MIGLPRHCGMSKFRAFWSNTPADLYREAHFFLNSYWVDVEMDFEMEVMETAVEGAQPGPPIRFEVGNLSRRNAKKLQKLLDKAAVPYYGVTAKYTH